MMKTKPFLIIQSALCILASVLLISATVQVYIKGSARRAADPTESIYTKEEAVSAAAPGTAVMIIALCFAVIGRLKGIHDENADRPVKEIDFDKERQMAYRGGAVGLPQVIIFVAAIICIAAGIVNGSMMDVLIKAVKVCTECIGLG